ncbi:VWA domain-containing protein [Flavobacterium cyanobacteriorum]|uniref:VWA domain-containing protein n=2 Tax=Flavobacterium cyanobacteriorum TaxID=2022802 RepID=A0A255Z9P4_9FLAO|nr:VWA domain-containing protein [Flavobacterium cyanobacteriorum]
MLSSPSSSENHSFGYLEEAIIESAVNKSVSATAETIQDRANALAIQSLQGQLPGLKIGTGSAQPGNKKSVPGGSPVASQNQITRVFTPQSDSGEFKVGVKVNREDKTTEQSLKDKGTSLTNSQDENTIVLRGVGTIDLNVKPLLIVDGIPVDEDNFRGINPNTVKDIKIVKDTQATSIYGSRGVNGVVVINTKMTRKERKRLRKRMNSINKIQQLFNPGHVEFKGKSPETHPKIPVDNEEYESFEENKFENPATAPLSTFSIDVDNASYTNVRRFLNNGQTVPKHAVRVEEMINFFKYQYPQPKGDAPFLINTEYSDAPWNPKHKLLKIGLKGKEIPSADLPASNFVFLIDVSGSMEDDNKLPLLKQSMKLLVNQMRREDRIAIVVYAGAAGLVLPSTSGAEKAKIIAALDNLNAGGSTAGGAGIELAYKTAQENFIKSGNNRVILATDGDFNVGASSDKDMQTLIEEKRKSGVFLTCLGYGMGNYKDAKLEILADKGNGNYAYIDNMQEATRFLDKEFKGSMYAIAKDVKIQIEFNPKHVQSYRLIGYENRKLRDEDFVNDAIDAGELGSGHTVTALYEIIPTGIESELFPVVPQLKYSTTQTQTQTGNYNDELATIKFRHKKPDEDKSKEIVQVIPNVAVPLQKASGDFKFAAAVAWFGLKLRDSKLIPIKETEAIKQLAIQGLQNDPEGYRAEFVRLVDMVK